MRRWILIIVIRPRWVQMIAGVGPSAIVHVKNHQIITKGGDSVKLNAAGYGTIKEAAVHYGVSRQFIHKQISLGRMGECVKVKSALSGTGEMWLIKKPFSRTRGRRDNGIATTTKAN